MKKLVWSYTIHDTHNYSKEELLQLAKDLVEDDKYFHGWTGTPSVTIEYVGPHEKKGGLYNVSVWEEE